MRRGRGLHFYRKRKNLNARIMQEIASWSMVVFMAIFLAFVLVYFVGLKTRVVGVSMENTLYNGQSILVSRLSYLVFPPGEGDVIAFHPNGNKNTHYYVKRVVAVPGDKVQILQGKLYVNGETVDYNYDKIADPGIAENEVTLGEDEFFVMGDNCNSSEDSRSGNIGVVERSTITGRAWFRYAGGGLGAGFIH